MDIATINQLFAKLDNRLLELSDYRKTIDITDQTDSPDATIPIGLIKSKLYEFGERGLQKLRASLFQIEDLLKKKESLVNNIRFCVGSDPFEQPFKDQPERLRSRQLKYYPALKKEILNYQTELLDAETFTKKLLSDSLSQQPSPDDALTNKTSSKLDPSQRTSSPTKSKDQLDVVETALFFDYLRYCKVIDELDDRPLAKHISSLTGYSPDSIRSKGLTKITSIKGDKVNKKGLYALTKIKKVLAELSKVVADDISSIKQR